MLSHVTCGPYRSVLMARTIQGYLQRSTGRGRRAQWCLRWFVRQSPASTGKVNRIGSVMEKEIGSGALDCPALETWKLVGGGVYPLVPTVPPYGTGPTIGRRTADPSFLLHLRIHAKAYFTVYLSLFNPALAGTASGSVFSRCREPSATQRWNFNPNLETPRLTLRSSTRCLQMQRHWQNPSQSPKRTPMRRPGSYLDQPLRPSTSNLRRVVPNTSYFADCNNVLGRRFQFSVSHCCGAGRRGPVQVENVSRGQDAGGWRLAHGASASRVLPCSQISHTQRVIKPITNDPGPLPKGPRRAGLLGHPGTAAQVHNCAPRPYPVCVPYVYTPVDRVVGTSATPLLHLCTRTST